MKGIYLMAAMFFFSSMGVVSCSDDEPLTTNQEYSDTDNSSNENESGNNNEGNDDSQTSGSVNITIGSHTFTATLADNETAQAFKALLPMSITMNELNGNEKYYYMSNSLPTNSYRPSTIQEGDLMLYGSDCLVLFYETFSSSYSYTRIGKIDNPSGLASAVGAGNVNVVFSIP